ncbi:membrane-associated protein [Cutibacterium acnes JCM 18909]|nr:membrane-associated protein [Cutibacterium acnes JCM 18909]
MRVKQASVVLLGVVLASVMVFLGLWQMNVFESQRDDSTQARINEPVITWNEAPKKADVMAQYGRRVTVTGTFQPSTTTLIGTSWPVRVVTGIKLTSGETMAVVRGKLSKGERVPAAPTGTITVTGVLAASEANDGRRDSQMPAAVLPSLRLEVLTQTWPQPLVPATLTLDEKKMHTLRGSPQRKRYSRRVTVANVIAATHCNGGFLRSLLLPCLSPSPEQQANIRNDGLLDAASVDVLQYSVSRETQRRRDQ